VGRLVPEKGVDVLIRACASAGLALRIVGDGRDREALESLAVSLGADVQFVGPLPSSGVREEMERAGVMAVPSLWHEVSPLVVLESIDAACPVVGTRTGGIPDLIGDGRGVLVAPGSIEELAEALKSVLSNPDVSRRMSAQAREYAKTEWTRLAWTQRVSAAYAAAGASLEL
jgi:glycosyltransferase involved in cell wall biosynthesis